MRPGQLEILWVGVLVVGLVAGAASAQAIYTWTDENGVEQFTDNPSSIPEKFRKKARVTSGGDINVIGNDAQPSSAPEKPAPRSQPARAEPEGPNKCVVMKKKVGDLEFSVSQQKTEYENRKRACEQSAPRVTRRGRVVPVSGCSETNGPTQLKARLDAEERKLEQLRDELRVIQIQGC
jgi:Domain of unknown function (DUF4124)